ncbi:MAG: glycosyltransferase family 39 protein, partial [Solirubrobacteraceae bacterium]|nr:glycosyltransferase family 39 protein [Solirubrobacteraceae bacterium]
MSTAPSTLPRPSRPPEQHAVGIGARPGSRLRRLATKGHADLLLLVLVASLLNLVNLGINGNANEYYSAAVSSMTQSWSNFFFGSFDPAGLQMVDKPPLALWVQAASAKVFGFSTWSFLVPQALMGVATTVLVWDLVRRRFGRAAGLVAGLALATTPTAVAVFRHNNPDALLMLCATLALWATVRAFETPHRTRWLVLAGVAVGLGFEAKMAAALLTVPAIVAAWLWVRPLGWGRSIRQLTAFGASAAAVGLAWPVAVWLTPAGSRPWVSGTDDNSIWSLIFGYNGLGRVLGQDGGPGGNTGGGPGGAGGSMFGGDTGILRLLNESLGSQGGWLLGLAAGSIAVLLVATRLRRHDPRTGFLIVTAGAFATTAVAFSFASGIFHPYYVSALAPFTAALMGAGLATMAGLRPAESSMVAMPTSQAGTPATSGEQGAGEEPAALADQSAPQGGLAAVARAEFPAAPRGGLWKDPADPQATHDEAGSSAAMQPASAAATADDTAPSTAIRVVGGLALVAGAVTEWVVLTDATQLGWLRPLLLAGTIGAGVGLVLSSSRRMRLSAVGVAAALLLVAPTVWAVQTPGHATSGTFPTGG